MGYGEIGGGGSLQWSMTHKGNTGSGIDPEPEIGDDLFLYIPKGTVVFAQAEGALMVNVKLSAKNDVQIAWGVDVVELTHKAETIRASAEQQNEIAPRVAESGTGV